MVPATGRVYDLCNHICPFIKEWIRFWFFEVETKEEYEMSRNLFFPWLQSLNDIGLPLNIILEVR